MKLKHGNDRLPRPIWGNNKAIKQFKIYTYQRSDFPSLLQPQRIHYNNNHHHMIRYDTTQEFNVDSKAEYTA